MPVKYYDNFVELDAAKLDDELDMDADFTNLFMKNYFMDLDDLLRYQRCVLVFSLVIWFVCIRNVLYKGLKILL